MKSQSVESILDELPPDIRDILTRHAVQQEEDINTVIKQWIINTAERITIPRDAQEPATSQDSAA